MSLLIPRSDDANDDNAKPIFAFRRHCKWQAGFVLVTRRLGGTEQKSYVAII